MHRLRSIVLVTVLVVLAASAAALALTDEESGRILSGYRTATLAAVTALSAGQIADIAVGRVLSLDAIGEASRQQILGAANQACGVGYRSWHDGLPAGAKLGFWIAPDFFITFEGLGFGTTGRETIPLSEAAPILAKRPGSDGLDANVTSPAVASVPSLASLLSGAPGDNYAKSEWLRSRAIDLLSPIGAAWLARGGSIPFGIAEFSSGQTMTLRSLSSSQSSWLNAIYSKHCLNTLIRQQILEKSRARNGSTTTTGSPTVVLDANTGVLADPETTPTYRLPKWSELPDSTTIKLSVRYLPTVTTSDSGAQCAKGIGWYLK